jgi:hypothetical protein
MIKRAFIKFSVAILLRLTTSAQTLGTASAPEDVLKGPLLA